MLTLDFLHNTLKTHPLSESMTSQTEFDKIVACIEQEKIVEAAGMIEKIVAKGTLDIRLIVYYFYAHFYTLGIKSFLESFPFLISLMKERWEDLKPVSRRDKHVQNSLNWFISQIIHKLKYCEKKAKTGQMDPIWVSSTVETSPEELEQVIAALTTFKDLFYEKWPASPTKERVMHLVKLVEDLKIPFSDETPQATDEEEEPEIEEEPVVENQEPEGNQEIEQDPVFDIPHEDPSPAIQPAAQHETGFCYENMKIIFDKLKIFELLISENEYAKAALVAKDIDHLIENFDPLDYFPKLFSNYFSLTARHVAALSVHWENESLQQKYLEKLYKTDTDMFIEW